VTALQPAYEAAARVTLASYVPATQDPVPSPTVVFVGAKRVDVVPTLHNVLVIRGREIAALGPLSGALKPQEVELTNTAARDRNVDRSLTGSTVSSTDSARSTIQHRKVP